MQPFTVNAYTKETGQKLAEYQVCMSGICVRLATAYVRRVGWCVCSQSAGSHVRYSTSQSAGSHVRYPTASPTWPFSCIPHSCLFT